MLSRTQWALKKKSVFQINMGGNWVSSIGELWTWSLFAFKTPSVVYSKHTHKISESKREGMEVFFHLSWKGNMPHMTWALVFFLICQCTCRPRRPNHPEMDLGMPIDCRQKLISGGLFISARCCLCAVMLKAMGTSLTLIFQVAISTRAHISEWCVGSMGRFGDRSHPSLVCSISRAGDGSCEQSYYHLLLIYS